MHCNFKSIGNINSSIFHDLDFECKNGSLNSARHHKIFLVESVEIYAQRGSLKFDLPHHLVALEHFYFVDSREPGCREVVFWVMGVCCCETVCCWLVRLFYIKGFYEISGTEVPKLNYILRGIVSGQKDITLKIEWISGHHWPTEFSHTALPNPHIPQPHRAIPPSREEQIRFLLNPLDTKNPISMIRVQRINMPSLIFLHKQKNTCISFLVFPS